MKLHSRGWNLDFNYPHVMGVVNMTPDSFSDGGEYNSVNQALSRAAGMVQDGATLLDIGGESTRPEAKPVSIDEELNRVIPIIEAISQRLEVWISIDTSKPEVMRAAVNSGAHLINDIRALQEEGALTEAAKLKVAVCLMHMQGAPGTMQEAPYYNDVVNEVENFFLQNLERCERVGICRNSIILDPGFGFGKKLSHNYQLLANLKQFNKMGVPLLVGMSRKSMIGQLLGVPLNKRVIGSVACAVIAAMYGARIIRVHDVKETVEALRIVQATLSEK